MDKRGRRKTRRGIRKTRRGRRTHHRRRRNRNQLGGEKITYGQKRILLINTIFNVIKDLTGDEEVNAAVATLKTYLRQTWIPLLSGPHTALEGPADIIIGNLDELLTKLKAPFLPEPLSSLSRTTQQATSVAVMTLSRVQILRSEAAAEAMGDYRLAAEMRDLYRVLSPDSAEEAVEQGVLDAAIQSASIADDTECNTAVAAAIKAADSADEVHKDCVYVLTRIRALLEKYKTWIQNAGETGTIERCESGASTIRQQIRWFRLDYRGRKRWSELYTEKPIFVIFAHGDLTVQPKEDTEQEATFAREGLLSMATEFLGAEKPFRGPMVLYRKESDPVRKSHMFDVLLNVSKQLLSDKAAEAAAAGSSGAQEKMNLRRFDSMRQIEEGARNPVKFAQSLTSPNLYVLPERQLIQENRTGKETHGWITHLISHIDPTQTLGSSELTDASPLYLNRVYHSAKDPSNLDARSLLLTGDGFTTQMGTLQDPGHCIKLFREGDRYNDINLTFEDHNDAFVALSRRGHYIFGAQIAGIHVFTGKPDGERDEILKGIRESLDTLEQPERELQPEPEDEPEPTSEADKHYTYIGSGEDAILPRTVRLSKLMEVLGEGTYFTMTCKVSGLASKPNSEEVETLLRQLSGQ
jgi:hypothetical protein